MVKLETTSFEEMQCMWVEEKKKGKRWKVRAFIGGGLGMVNRGFLAIVTTKSSLYVRGSYCWIRIYRKPFIELGNQPIVILIDTPSNLIVL